MIEHINERTKLTAQFAAMARKRKERMTLSREYGKKRRKICKGRRPR